MLLNERLPLWIMISERLPEVHRPEREPPLPNSRTRDPVAHLVQWVLLNPLTISIIDRDLVLGPEEALGNAVFAIL